MRVVVVTEKPSLSQALAATARAWIGPGPHLAFVSTMMLGAYRYAMPRHLTWSDYPLVHTPDRLVARDPHVWRPMTVDSQGLLTARPDEEALALLQGADRLVFACDPDHTGVIGFDLSVKGALGLPLNDQTTLAGVTAWTLMALDLLSVRRSVAQGGTFADFAAKRRYGEVRRYFDHQFLINSWGILGRCLEQVGAPREPALSKYMVQVLYRLQERDRQRDERSSGTVPVLFTEGTLVRAMKQWEGTGRYPADQAVNLGSAASRSQILDNLRALGLLHELSSGNVRRLGLSARGQALLDLLHPGCEDRDLPFRLHAWAMAGMEAAGPAIDRYVRTWFGRQKRRLDTGAILKAS